MDFKKINKDIARFFSWLGLSLCSLIIKVLPGRFLYSFAQGIARLGYLVVRKQRNLAIESLSLAFNQERTPAEIEQITRDCFTFMAKSGVELLFLLQRPGLLKRRVAIRGKENLDAALSRGKGAILVSAHFGSFPLLMSKMSLEGYRISGIMRPMRDARVERFFLAKRQELGVKTIYSQPRRVCVETTIKALRKNELVFIPIDQNFGTAGIFVNFFGRKAATATGPVVLAQRTGAAILPCFIIRQDDDTHQIVFEPPLDLIEGESPQETLVVNIQKLTEIIESYIRKYPAQWGWIHRRWKTKPN